MLQLATNVKGEEKYYLGIPAIAWETAESRIKELKEFLLNAPQQMAPERIQYVLEIYKKYQGEAPIYIRARLFEKLLTTKPLFLDDNPIVGTMTSIRAGVYAYPEYNVNWIKDELDLAMMSHLGEVQMSPETRKLMNEVYNTWKGRTNIDRANGLLKELHGIEAEPLFKAGLIFDNCSHAEGVGVADYPRVLNEGMGSMLKDVEARLQACLPTKEKNKTQIDFYRSAQIVLKAVIALANRYAALAEETAAKESNPGIKAELLEIAEVCRRVPEHPARTFREAVQSFWLTHLCLELEQAGCATSPGRYGQYMYPFYKKDLEEGRITSEQAMTLLKFQWIRHLEVGVYQGQAIALQLSGHTGQTISLGGVTADGQDATNDLEMLILDVQIAMRNIQPTLSVFYHNNMREDFLNKVVELIRCGTGQPQIMNNTVAVQRNLQRWAQNNITLADARNVANFGCVATGVCGKSALSIDSLISVAKIFELTINNGWDPVTKKQIGPKTGNPEEFESFEAFYDAFLAQMDFAVRMDRVVSCVGNMIKDKQTPSPFRSVMEGGCIERGIHEEAGGPYFFQSLMIVNAGVDAANSLSAVKHLVYDQKTITMKELRTALAADFKGYENIQKLCISAPKHGNDNPEMDALTHRIYKDLADRFDSIHPANYVGEKIAIDAYSVSMHNYLGRLTGALPTGRNGGKALTDGSVSAMPGTDVEGPTAFINSAAKVIDTVRYAANHCNMKFHPAALQGPTGARMLLSLIKSYCDMGGSHIQFNCVKGETLRDAQKNPARHKDLVVRVAGFSAFFIRLDKGVQDEIIKRTEYAI